MQNGDSTSRQDAAAALESQDRTSALSRPGPNNPPWNSFFAFILWLASVSFIFVFPLFFVMPYAVSEGVNLGETQSVQNFLQNDPAAVLLNLAAILPAHFFTFLLAWILVTRYKEFSFREMLGWEWGGFKFWHGAGILGGFFIVAVVVGQYFPEQDNDLLRILRSSRSAVFLVAFIATFTAPLVEEIVYRGVLYSAFQRSIGVPAAVIVVTILFAIVHVPQYLPSYSTIVLITLLSLILTLVRVWTNNLLPCVVLHIVFNGFQSLLLILEPYFPAIPTGVEQKAAAILRIMT